MLEGPNKVGELSSRGCLLLDGKVAHPLTQEATGKVTAHSNRILPNFVATIFRRQRANSLIFVREASLSVGNRSD